MRLVLADILRSDPSVNIMATANNGKDGAEKVKEFRPDVVVTDLVMPDYDGIYAIEAIRKHSNVPIMVLSAANSSSTMVFEAMAAGATDFMEKPQGGATKVRSVDYQLVEALKTLVKTTTGGTGGKGKSVTNQHVFAANLPYDIIVIGSSTGGPSAVEEVLKKLPGNLPIPVVIAQHMPANFIQPFATRLNSVTPLEVSVAKPGERLKGRKIYICGGDTNTELQGTGAFTKFKSNTNHYADFNNPSVTCLFDATAEVYGAKAIAIMLTGMGKDGATGMKKIHDKGGFCIAQEASTCVVNGMPGAAVKIGAVNHQIKLKDIAAFVVSSLSD